VAVNLYRTRGEDPASKFFLSVQKQKYSYQGVWIVDPAGKVTLISFTKWNSKQSEAENVKARLEKFLGDLDESLKTFGPMQPRSVKWQDPLPWRGVGVQPDGKVTMALYVRHAADGKATGLPAVDSVTFDAKEWASFAPAKVEVGARWNIPAEVAGKFNRVSDGIWDVSIKPEHAKLAELQAVVEAVDGKAARIRLTGKVESAWIKPFNNPKKKTTHGWCEIEGFASYDAEQKTLTSVLLLIRAGLPNDLRDKQRGTLLSGFAEWSRAKVERSAAKE
jgi:hypothetical protein